MIDRPDPTTRPAVDGAVPWPPEVAAAHRAAGYWTGETHAGVLTERAGAHPDRTAVVDDDRALTYGGLHEAAQRFAAGFAAQGIVAGDRVVVQLPNVVRFVEVVFGLFRLGALPVFSLPAHRAVEIEHLCGLTDAAGYITTTVLDRFDHRGLVPIARAASAALRLVAVDGDPGDDPDVRPLDDLAAATADPSLPSPAPDDLAFLQLSGGSTGVPKLIPRTHDEYLYSVRESARICRLGPDSTYLAVLPAAHNFTLSSPGILGALHAGGTVALADNPRPDVAFAAIERHRATITAVVPSAVRAWLDAAPGSAADRSSLEVLQVGGARLADDVARRIGPELGCRLQQVFGMAEGLVNYTRLDDPDELVATTQGRPISPADELLVVDDDDDPVPPGEPGHLLTRGPYTIRGYYRAEAHNRTAFTSDGFYRTGDVVRVTPEGYVQVVGRAKDQINRAGEKIAVEEVDGHLHAHPDVADAAVVGEPDDVLGERVVAHVVARRGATLTGPAVRRFLRERGLATFKIPDRVEVVAELPRTAVGKTARRALRDAPGPTPPPPAPPSPPGGAPP